MLDERVLFDFNRARVRSDAKPLLAAIVELRRQHPEWDRMVVEGYADERGTEDYNLRLSERRARNVEQALLALGMSAGEIEIRGFGEARPRAPGDTEDAYQKNRRVEFVMIESRKEILRVNPDEAAAPAAGGQR